MNEFGIINLSRRDFLKAGMGLTLGITVPSLAQMAGPGQGGGSVVAAGALEPNAFVRIGTDSTVALIGRRLTRTDTRAKSNGTAIYTQDVKLPGMLTALVAHPPRFGGKPKAFDAAKAKAVKGVVDVVAIPQGVAVLASDFWSAKKGRDALAVEWDESGA